MDRLTPASEVEVAYLEALAPYEYGGPPPFARDDPSLFTLSSEGGSTRTTSPYTPPDGNHPLLSQFDNAYSDPCQMNRAKPPVPVLHQPKLTTLTGTTFSDMWKNVGGEVYGGLSVVDGYSAGASFDTLFERLGFMWEPGVWQGMSMWRGLVWLIFSIAFAWKDLLFTVMSYRSSCS